jgi:hypothetical protein
MGEGEGVRDDCVVPAEMAETELDEAAGTSVGGGRSRNEPCNTGSTAGTSGCGLDVEGPGVGPSEGSTSLGTFLMTKGEGEGE